VPCAAPAVADNQAQLLRLAKHQPSIQRRAAIALREGAADIKQAMLFACPHNPQAPESDVQEKILSQLMNIRDQASHETRAAFDEYRARKDAQEVAA